MNLPKIRLNHISKGEVWQWTPWVIFVLIIRSLWVFMAFTLTHKTIHLAIFFTILWALGKIIERLVEPRTP